MPVSEYETGGSSPTMTAATAGTTGRSGDAALGRILDRIRELGLEQNLVELQTRGMPAPFSHVSQVANVNYALTSYSREAGALALVPGSHELARQPRPEEAVLGGPDPNPRALAMDFAPGDAVVWHGNTWYGSFECRLPGVRVNLAVYFCRRGPCLREHEL